MRRAARYGDGWYPYLYTLRRLRASIEKVKEFAAEEGRDLSGFHWGVLQPTCIADSKEEALRIATENVGRRYVTPRTSAEDIARALCITGTTQDCIKEVEARIEAGVRDIVFMWIAPNQQAAREQMRKVAKEVLPYFRG
jgi:alkanesulfonate monooxygenase SsuD/methylene tetrahydromethanopterin reductase-like flavin-dependent oxidoreductase (luciferase family)